MARPPLGYGTNLHAAESVDEICAALAGPATRIRARLGWDRLGVDLRLGSLALAEGQAGIDRLRRTLDQHRLSAHTLNGFPLRPFQAAVVKRDAYLPDWSERERLDRSLDLLHAALALSDEPEVTISTVPGTYRPFGPPRTDAEAIASNLGRWAAAAARVRRDTGRSAVLCLEPEPWCVLETSTEVAAFWCGPLATQGLAAATAALDGDADTARVALARHLGICFDTCHFSLAFEDQAEAVTRITAAGARIAKCQVSAAPVVVDPGRNPAGVAALAALAEPRFLHQTAACRRLAAGQNPAAGWASPKRVEDLDQLATLLARMPDATEVRSHFHVPLDFIASERGLTTTIADTRAGLAACIAAGCPHIAVETYTWSVLPQAGDPVDGTVRELRWLAAALAD